MLPGLTAADLTGMRSAARVMFTSQVTLERRTGHDQYGKALYTPPEVVPAWVVEKEEQFYGPAGQLAVSTAQILVPPFSGVTADDRITLPDGTRVSILMVQSLPGPSMPVMDRIVTGPA